MEERGRGKRNMHSEKNKDERNRQLEAMTEEERDDYFRCLLYTSKIFAKNCIQSTEKNAAVHSFYGSA